MMKGLTNKPWHHLQVILAGWLLVSQVYAAVPKATVKLMVTDAQGTVVATMTPQGDVTYTAAYRPYGKQAEGTPQSGPGYTEHVNDPDTGLVYMQQRYYDPAIGRFISPDPVAPTPGNVFNFGRYTYANNNPIRYIDPDGRVCKTVGGKASCTFDGFKDTDGNIISRKEALSSGSRLAKFFHVDRGSHILHAEAEMTAKYSAAKNLAARGGSVTIKGNGKLGIPDQKISGSTIVSHMETIKTIANPSPNSVMPNMIAGSPIDRTQLGTPSNGPITFYKDGTGASDLGKIFGHEILHTIYSGIGLPNGGWANPDFNIEHQIPFNEASDAIQ